jgi:hypothetical protein
VTAVSFVDDWKTTPVAVFPPTVTVAVLSKFDPTIVIVEPPSVEPASGVTDETIGVPLAAAAIG